MPRAKKPNMYSDVFPSRLRTLIEESGATQAAIVEDIKKKNPGVSLSRQAFNAYTLGDTAPDIQRFKAIADYFDVTYDYLLGVSDSRQRENLDITKETGLNDASIAILKEKNNKDNPFRLREIAAINKVFSSNTLVDLLISYLSIEGRNGKYTFGAERPNSTENVYEITATPDVYGLIIMNMIQGSLEELGATGSLRLYRIDKTEEEVPTDGEHPQN